MANDSDVFTALDGILSGVDVDESPWATPAGRPQERVYVPDYALARRLLAVPIGEGKAEEQQSGRVAKALDAWIAHELRRAGFAEGAVTPRRRRPRALSPEIAELEAQIDVVMSLLEQEEARLRERGEGTYLRPVAFRHAVARLRRLLPGAASASILGRFYVKQVDVVVSSWQHGPDVLVSTKTQFSSYLNNKNNRYEEALGEATNLRDRHPMAAMGFAFAVRSNIYDERGAFEYLRHQLARLRRPDGPYDATMLLVLSWDDDLTLAGVEDGVEELTARAFFEDLLNAVMSYTPVSVHEQLRLRKHGEPTGGMPPSESELASAPDA